LGQSGVTSAYFKQQVIIPSGDEWSIRIKGPTRPAHKTKSLTVISIDEPLTSLIATLSSGGATSQGWSFPGTLQLQQMTLRFKRSMGPRRTSTE